MVDHKHGDADEHDDIASLEPMSCEVFKLLHFRISQGCLSLIGYLLLSPLLSPTDE
jgi:hypothetical protein